MIATINKTNILQWTYSRNKLTSGRIGNIEWKFIRKTLLFKGQKPNLWQYEFEISNEKYFIVEYDLETKLVANQLIEHMTNENYPNIPNDNLD